MSRSILCWRRRAEKTILLIVVTGDKGLAGAFSANITKAASRFIESKAGKNIDIEAIGRKGRDFLRRRYPAAAVQTRSLAETEESLETQPEAGKRAGAIQITGEHVGVLGKLEFSQARALAESVIRRYQREEIDAVYVVFNEFKSVIAQRLIVEQILPIEQIGEQAVRLAEEMTEEEKKKAKEAAISAGVGLRSSEPAGEQPRRNSELHSAQGRWITSTSRPRRNCSARCCRNMLPSRFSARCWNRWRPNMPRA